MSLSRRIYGGRVITPHGVLNKGTVVIEGGHIVEVSPRTMGCRSGDIDASGLWVMPGLIDTHSDAIEIELQPRPNSIMPFEVSFFELEKKLVVQGITTMYHCLSFSEIPGNTLRANQTVVANVARVHDYARSEHALINHRIHVRYEIRNMPGAEFVKELIKDGRVHQLSFMDHTPGQGQFKDVERLLEYMIKRRNLSPEEAQTYVTKRMTDQKADVDTLTELALLARGRGIALATHDDDRIERLDLLESWGGRICEFPVRLDVAQEAKRRGLFVVVGATNLLLGRSHSGNMSAIDAVEAGCVDILCSDYYPPALLRGVFLLHEKGYPIEWCVNLVTANPARALGIDEEVGSLEAGKRADVAMVGQANGLPVLEQVLVAGRPVCRLDYMLPDRQLPA